MTLILIFIGILMCDTKGKTCCDCLHCKVSAKSKNIILCFCAKTKKKEKHRINHWQKKNVCRKFFDMSLDEKTGITL
jgi:hypothetical protein